MFHKAPYVSIILCHVSRLNEINGRPKKYPILLQCTLYLMQVKHVLSNKLHSSLECDKINSERRQKLENNSDP